jgi:hypothetical protein
MSLSLHATPPHLTPVHLTNAQIGELLSCPSSPTAAGIDAESRASAEAHLLTCAACAAEVASLRSSLTLFQQSCTACADREFAHVQKHASPSSLPHWAYPQTALWATAAALIMAAILPLDLRLRSAGAPQATVAAASTHSAESDEALLDDINRELSASVPAPMQALADPTGSVASTSFQPLTQTSTQRKD